MRPRCRNARRGRPDRRALISSGGRSVDIIKIMATWPLCYFYGRDTGDDTPPARAPAQGTPSTAIGIRRDCGIVQAHALSCEHLRAIGWVHCTSYCPFRKSGAPHMKRRVLLPARSVIASDRCEASHRLCIVGVADFLPPAPSHQHADLLCTDWHGAWTAIVRPLPSLAAGALRIATARWALLSAQAQTSARCAPARART